MNKRLLLFASLFILSMLLAVDADAQCAMCKKVAEGKGNGNVSNNLNAAILYLMATPYVLLMFVFRKKIVAILQFIWGFIFFRRKSA